MTVSTMERIREKNIPFYALIELTHRCNLGCCHCYLPTNRSTDELSADQFKDILAQLADAGTLFITFSGGEVFLRNDFFKIATYARERHFAIRIFTNGTLIDEKVVDKIKDLNPLSVEISIYGPDSRLHDRITNVPGSFDMSVKAIRLLKEKGIEVGIKTPLMTLNVGSYKEVISLAHELKVKYELNMIISPKLDGSSEPLSYRIDGLEVSKIVSKELPVPDITKIKEKFRNLASKDDLLMCGAGRSSCLISPVGEIYPCAILRISFGNAVKQPFLKGWQSSQAIKLRAMKFCDLRTCAECELVAYCNRCAGIALLEDGDLLGPAKFYCEMAKINKESLTKINQNGGRNAI